MEAGAEGAAGRRCCTGLESPLALSLANSAFRRRATGGSIVEEADLTNSHMSLSFSSTVLLSTFKTLASSYTRGFATNYSYSVTTRVHGRGQLVMTASLPCLIVRP